MSIGFPGIGNGGFPSSGDTFSNPIFTGVVTASTITAPANTDLTLNAGSGGNNSINLYLPGTGPVRVGSSGGTYAAAAALAIASSTSSTAGIAFGTDTAIYRGTASGNPGVTFSQPLYASNGGTATPSISFLNAPGTGLAQSGGNALQICSNGSLALTLSSSQAATFAGTVQSTGYLSSDGTAGLTQASTTTLGKSITVKNGLIVAFA